MHIAIETSPLVSGHKLRGTGSYTRQLIEALRKYERKHSYYLFTRGQKLPKSIDVIHYPYFEPFFLTLPIIKTRPTVVTVHDLIPIAYEDHFPRGIRGEVKWRVQKTSLRGARAILTDSFASQKDIARIAALPEQKIHVVYLSPSDSMKPVSDKRIREGVRKKYRMPEQFILYVGDVNWNKNIPGLLHAFAEVKKIFPSECLVLAGKQFRKSELDETKQINKLISDLGLKSGVLSPGYVEQEDLATFYSMASVCVQPSFAEGFGLPVLEAMACGCPVVASDTTSLKEIAGPSRLVDPSDITSISSGIIETLKASPPKRTELIKRGFEWVRKFSWQNVARETVQVYERVLA